MPILRVPTLRDRVIELARLSQSDLADMLDLTDDDDVRAYTRVPVAADEAFAGSWIARYEAGWGDGTCAGFSVRDHASGAFLGFAAVVDLELEERQGELGYIVAPAARGRGTATRALRLLTRWCFDELELERIELRIDPRNVASQRIAARVGYRLEGVLRNVHLKDGLRCDAGVWSRLRDDPEPEPA